MMIFCGCCWCSWLVFKSKAMPDRRLFFLFAGTAVCDVKYQEVRVHAFLFDIFIFFFVFDEPVQQ